MKQIAWLAFALTALTLWAETPACPMPGEWVFDEKLSDEFDGKVLDATKWWDFNPEWYGRKPGYFARENVAVQDGLLQITAKAQKPEEVSVENQARGHHLYTTGTIKSKACVKYGYFEARCKSMKANVCNAFWLYDPLRENPAKYRDGSFSEEIDIFEVFGKPKSKEMDRVCFATVHRFITPYVESIVNSKQTPLPDKSGKPKVDFDFWAEFHTYGLLWTPAELKWFVDGKEVFARKNDFYHTALYVMFDAEIMQAWSGLPDAEDLPATFSTDYVRVWRQKAQ